MIAKHKQSELTVEVFNLGVIAFSGIVTVSDGNWKTNERFNHFSVREFDFFDCVVGCKVGKHHELCKTIVV